jgi:hypothetical protein
MIIIPLFLFLLDSLFKRFKRKEGKGLVQWLKLVILATIKGRW